MDTSAQAARPGLANTGSARRFCLYTASLVHERSIQLVFLPILVSKQYPGPHHVQGQRRAE
jgi:hypothetical protein